MALPPLSETQDATRFVINRSSKDSRASAARTEDNSRIKVNFVCGSCACTPFFLSQDDKKTMLVGVKGAAIKPDKRTVLFIDGKLMAFVENQPVIFTSQFGDVSLPPGSATIVQVLKGKGLLSVNMMGPALSIRLPGAVSDIPIPEGRACLVQAAGINEPDPAFLLPVSIPNLAEETGFSHIEFPLDRRLYFRKETFWATCTQDGVFHVLRQRMLEFQKDLNEATNEQPSRSDAIENTR